MTEWQPIDTAPKDGTKILVYVPAGHYKGVHVDLWSTRQKKSGEWWHSTAIDPPTHWMPLPTPPTTSLQGED